MACVCVSKYSYLKSSVLTVLHPLYVVFEKQYKDICPTQRLKDLEALVHSVQGDEETIKQTLQDWWAEDEKPREPDWKEINGKGNKKKPESNPSVSARSGGRGRNARGGPAGRGMGRDGGSSERRNVTTGARDSSGRGRGGRVRNETRGKSTTVLNAMASTSEEKEQDIEKISKEMTPAGSSESPTLPGAWGQSISTPNSDSKSPAQLASLQPIETQDKSLDSQVVALSPVPIPALQSSVRSTGNVWALKGSAHLIKAEHSPKQRPPLQPEALLPVLPTVKPVTDTKSKRASIVSPPIPESSAPLVPSTLESELPASVNGANINAVGWKPSTETTTLDSLASTISQSIVKESQPPKPPSPVIVPKPQPTNVLNLGHWETGENDETQHLDFGFGSFGAENETPSVGETTLSNSTPSVVENPKDSNSGVPPSASPARPPPGLSIGGSQQLPPNAVLVSELESKLEGASIGHHPHESVAIHIDPNIMQGMPPGVTASHLLPQIGGMAQNYSTAAYGMAGMYNYGAGGNGFMHGAPVLTGGIPAKPQGSLSGQTSTTPQQMGSLYGTATNPASSSNDLNGTSSDVTMPPGMPNMAAYNPALFYGQQPYPMGQPHSVGGYGYGYGAQFGGAVQGGFSYQQGMMGQSGGYPAYEDPQQQQQANAGGYQKSNASGYRGRGGNQYQNQYQPQGGYGGQPYAMGYNDHFNQRGGYVPGTMDPYGMPQGGNSFAQSHTFQSEDDQQKSAKKGGGRNNGSFQQPHVHQIGGQQQSFGLQGDSNANSNAGWSNQAGGWGGPSWQGS
jgi:hypothetical protein